MERELKRLRQLVGLNYFALLATMGFLAYLYWLFIQDGQNLLTTQEAVMRLQREREASR